MTIMWELIEDVFTGLFRLIGWLVIVLLIAGFGYRFIYVAGPTVPTVQARTQCTAKDVQILQLSLQRKLNIFVEAIGEMKNNCAHAIGLTYIQITFRDTAGKIVAVDNVGCTQMRINPGERCSFSHPAMHVGPYATTETKVDLILPPS
jgi:hypothetical protein